MHAADLDGLPVAEIMSRWPATIGVFLRFRLHCVGCPVSAFNTLEDAAAEHACSFPDLRSAVLAAIADAETSAAEGPRHT
jgi:hybrid cluster-associated redox disulfide protein